MTQGEFYNDKFCVWLDTRSTYDNKVHGNGLRLHGGDTGIDVVITKSSDSGGGNFLLYVYLVIDATIDFQGSSYKQVCYAIDSCPEIGENM